MECNLHQCYLAYDNFDLQYGIVLKYNTNLSCHVLHHSVADWSRNDMSKRMQLNGASELRKKGFYIYF